MNRKIVIVSGPTASGKSKLGLDLAREFNGEVISADSVAVYKYFDIGSAKPSSEELSTLKHHLISELEPDADFSAGKFAKIATERIEEILSKGKIPIVVGGTGLYIRALLNGLISDRREELDAEVSWDDLNEVDPLSAKNINPNDQTRIKRAFDFFLRYGRSITEARATEVQVGLNVSALIILVEPEREALYEKINLRSKKMLDDGLIEESQQLLEKYGGKIKPLGAIGYIHAVKFLKKEFYSLEETLKELSQDTRRFAKRQLTWWRNQPKALGWTVIKETRILADVTSAVRAFLESNEKLGHTREIIRYTPIR